MGQNEHDKIKILLSHVESLLNSYKMRDFEDYYNDITFQAQLNELKKLFDRYKAFTVNKFSDIAWKGVKELNSKNQSHISYYLFFNKYLPQIRRDLFKLIHANNSKEIKGDHIDIGI